MNELLDIDVSIFSFLFHTVIYSSLMSILNIVINPFTPGRFIVIIIINNKLHILKVYINKK